MRLPKGLNVQITKNFSSIEYACKCSRESCKYTYIDIDHAVKLQRLRDEVGPLKITSAYRCPEHNKDVGGSKNSQHTKGTATDIVSTRLDSESLSEFIGESFDGKGVYSTFVHIDSRGTKARWRG